jgi:hypothetical protein
VRFRAISGGHAGRDRHPLRGDTHFASGACADNERTTGGDVRVSYIAVVCTTPICALAVVETESVHAR